MNSSSTMDSPIDLVWAYHEASKHRFKRYAPGPGFLDWENQPDPFRHWVGTTLRKLPLGQSTFSPGYDEIYTTQREFEPFSQASLSLFLELSMGLSAWKCHGADRWALRNNPSSGNLHPTEAYLLLWQPLSDELAPGLYHYEPYQHGLEQRASLTTTSAQALAATHPDTLGAIGLSTIVWREAWKYGARAYRYCQLDTGHALGALRYAAANFGWSLQMDPCLADTDIGALLGLDRAGDFEDAEPEYPELLAAFGKPGMTLPRWTDINLTDWRGNASHVSLEHAEWPQIARLLPAIIKSGHTEFEPWQAPPGGDSFHSTTNRNLIELIRSRRSAQRMDGQTHISLADFTKMLARTLPRLGVPPLDSYPYTPAVNLLIFAHKVECLEPGLYILVRNPDSLPALRRAMHSERFSWLRLERAQLPLYRLRAPSDTRKLAAQLSCHQGIAAHGAFAVSMLADLDSAFSEDGAWAWRRLHWEAGLVGQILYLEAESNGLSGTGIGCFFDDEVLSLFGLQAPWQVLYHFTVGAAVDDPRLTTEAAYAHLSRTPTP